MKKIFLTSGIVVCMACPAFATGSGFTLAQTEEAASNNQVVANACVEPSLGVYSGTTTLRAIWEAAGQSVNYATGWENTDYAASVANMPETPDSVTFDAQYKVAVDKNNNDAPITPTLKGYRFQNWSSDYDLSDGTNTATTYNSGATIAQYKVASPAVATLTAQWTAFASTIVYDKGTATNGTISHSGNEISGTVSTENVTYDQTGYTAADNSTNNYDANHVGYGIDGYHFTGWSSDYNTATGASTPTGTSYAAGASLGDSNGKYKVDPGNGGHVTMTAQWAPDTYTVEYSCGTGAVGTAATTTANTNISYDQVNFQWAGNSDSADCYKAGSYFTGWTCSVDSQYTTTGSDINIITDAGVTCGTDGNNDPTHICTGSTVSQWTTAGLKNGAVIECTAQYATNTISLGWNLNGGALPTGGTQGGQTCTYGGGVTLPTNPTKPGFTFKGWEVTGATEESGLSRS